MGDFNYTFEDDDQENAEESPFNYTFEPDNYVENNSQNIGTAEPIEQSALEQVGDALQGGYQRGKKFISQNIGELSDETDQERMDRSVRMADMERKAQSFDPGQDMQSKIAQINDSQSVGEFVQNVWDNPEAVGIVTLQSIGMFAPVLAGTTAVGASTGGAAVPFALAAASGLGSASTEYAATMSEELQQSGYDPADPMAWYDAHQDSELMSRARDRGAKRGIAIGLFDALSAGVAGKLLAGAKPTATSVIGRGAAEMGVQASAGMGGEAAAQIVDKGEIESVGSIGLEGIAEVPMSIPEQVFGYKSAKEVALSKQKNAELDEVVASLDQEVSSLQDNESAIDDALDSLHPVNAKMQMDANGNFQELYQPESLLPETNEDVITKSVSQPVENQTAAEFIAAAEASGEKDPNQSAEDWFYEAELQGSKADTGNNEDVITKPKDGFTLPDSGKTVNISPENQPVQAGNSVQTDETTGSSDVDDKDSNIILNSRGNHWKSEKNVLLYKRNKKLGDEWVPAEGEKGWFLTNKIEGDNNDNARTADVEHSNSVRSDRSLGSNELDRGTKQQGRGGDDISASKPASDNGQDLAMESAVRHTGAKDKGRSIGEEESTHQAEAELKQSIPDSVELDALANESSTSELNDLEKPTKPQIEADNYKKGHVKYDGLNISIENPAGSKRKPEWPALKHHYGDIKTTQGADGDAVDVFINKDNEKTDTPVFIINQTSKDGKFDEHKVMLGFNTEGEARQGYLDNYSNDWVAPEIIPQLSMPEFKAWLADGDTKKPYQSLTEKEDKIIGDKAQKNFEQSKKQTEVIAGRLSPDPSQDDLITFIRKIGGINTDYSGGNESDLRGRLKHLNEENKTPGLKSIEQTGDAGFNLDDLGEKLIEAGYLDRDPNIGNGVDQEMLLDLLDKAESGVKIYGSQGSEKYNEISQAEESRYYEEQEAAYTEWLDDAPNRWADEIRADLEAFQEQDTPVRQEMTRLIDQSSSIDEQKTEDILSLNISDKEVNQLLKQFIEGAENAKEKAIPETDKRQEKNNAENEVSEKQKELIEKTDSEKHTQSINDQREKKDEDRNSKNKPEPKTSSTGDDLFSNNGQLESDLFAESTEKSARSKPEKNKTDSVLAKEVKAALSASTETTEEGFDSLDDINLEASNDEMVVTDSATNWLKTIDDRILSVNRLRGCM